LGTSASVIFTSGLFGRLTSLVKVTSSIISGQHHNILCYNKYKQWPLILNELTEHRNEHDIRCWKSMSWLGTGTKMWQSYTCYWDPWISYKQIYTYIYINIYKQMIKKNMHRFQACCLIPFICLWIKYI
jgi:hypothetical protein